MEPPYIYYTNILYYTIQGSMIRQPTMLTMPDRVRCASCHSARCILYWLSWKHLLHPRYCARHRKYDLLAGVTGVLRWMMTYLYSWSWS